MVWKIEPFKDAHICMYVFVYVCMYVYVFCPHKKGYLLFFWLMKP
jgi:hypothetical protein